jgi:hypothetical protein
LTLAVVLGLAAVLVGLAAALTLAIVLALAGVFRRRRRRLGRGAARRGRRRRGRLLRRGRFTGTAGGAKENSTHSRCNQRMRYFHDIPREFDRD